MATHRARILRENQARYEALQLQLALHEREVWRERFGDLLPMSLDLLRHGDHSISGAGRSSDLFFRSKRHFFQARIPTTEGQSQLIIDDLNAQTPAALDEIFESAEA